MECAVPLGCTNRATLGVKLLVVSVSALQVNCGCLLHFNGHTMAAFPVKCMEEPAFGSPPVPTHLL